MRYPTDWGYITREEISKKVNEGEKVYLTRHQIRSLGLENKIPEGSEACVEIESGFGPQITLKDKHDEIHSLYW